MAEAEPIGLKELIARVKAELLEEHDESQPLFAIGQIELTIAFAVERNLKGGINLQVVQVGGDRKSSEVQTVKVALQPLVDVEEIRKGLTPDQASEVGKVVTRVYRPRDRETPGRQR